MKKIAFLTSLLTCAAILALAPAAAQRAEIDYSKIEVQATDLGHGLTALTGAGGTITVAVGTDGIIMVDADYAPMHDKIKAAITKLSSLPVKYVINTHYHVDHTTGDEAFAKDGAIIVAHENVPKRLPKPASGKSPMPVQTYSGQGTEVSIVGQKAELVHMENAHTDGDTLVFWPAANVISAGDIVYSTTYPNFYPTVGGSLDGMIVGTDFVIAHSDAKTKIVPGHGPVTDKAGVIAYRKLLVTARTRIAKAKAKGMTEKQVEDAHLLADLDKKWAPQGDAQTARFIAFAYQSIK